MVEKESVKSMKENKEKRLRNRGHWIEEGEGDSLAKHDCGNKDVKC